MSIDMQLCIWRILQPDISTIFTIWIVFYQIEKNKKSLHYSCKDSKSSSFYWHVITCLNDSLLDNTRILKALFSTEIIEKKKKKKTKAIGDWFNYNHYQINNLVASHQSNKLIKKNLELQRKISIISYKQMKTPIILKSSDYIL